ncbi:hypothetical protein A3F66_00485 [candidate division TM6 bacterium RIFCSPHIGHO2_12_FULL_32_22]|nr:MAG: hypothetical protein A3F66_00485 [candidate division TM6 bacterium RIFCSPHIGHO2_12_FULL_32_22]
MKNIQFLLSKAARGLNLILVLGLMIPFNYLHASDSSTPAVCSGVPTLISLQPSNSAGTQLLSACADQAPADQPELSYYIDPQSPLTSSVIAVKQGLTCDLKATITSVYSGFFTDLTNEIKNASTTTAQNNIFNKFFIGDGNSLLNIIKNHCCNQACKISTPFEVPNCNAQSTAENNAISSVSTTQLQSDICTLRANVSNLIMCVQGEDGINSNCPADSSSELKAFTAACPNLTISTAYECPLIKCLQATQTSANQSLATNCGPDVQDCATSLSTVATDQQTLSTAINTTLNNLLTSMNQVLKSESKSTITMNDILKKAATNYLQSNINCPTPTASTNQVCCTLPTKTQPTTAAEIVNILTPLLNVTSVTGTANNSGQLIYGNPSGTNPTGGAYTYNFMAYADSTGNPLICPVKTDKSGNPILDKNGNPSLDTSNCKSSSSPSTLESGYGFHVVEPGYINYFGCLVSNYLAAYYQAETTRCSGYLTSSNFAAFQKAQAGNEQAASQQAQQQQNLGFQISGTITGIIISALFGLFMYVQHRSQQNQQKAQAEANKAAQDKGFTNADEMNAAKAAGFDETHAGAQEYREFKSLQEKGYKVTNADEFHQFKAAGGKKAFTQDQWSDAMEELPAAKRNGISDSDFFDYFKARIKNPRLRFPTWKKVQAIKAEKAKALDFTEKSFEDQFPSLNTKDFKTKLSTDYADNDFVNFDGKLTTVVDGELKQFNEDGELVDPNPPLTPEEEQAAREAIDEDGMSGSDMADDIHPE